MLAWPWLLKWGWTASGFFLLIFLFATWHSAGAGKDDAQPVASRDSGLVVELPQVDAVAVATAGTVDRKAAAQVLPYQLVFTYGLLPLTLGGQPSPDQADFIYVQIGDVTGDGRDDLVSMGYVSDPPNDEVFHVYPQLSDGTLGAPMGYLVPQNVVMGLALADMNNDGTKDVVLTGVEGVSLALSDGHGKLRMVPFSSTTGDKKNINLPTITLDLDQDGNLDVIAHLSVAHADFYDTSEDRRSRFRVFYGDGAGGTTRSEDFAIFGVDYHDYGAFDVETPTALVVKDINQDGYPDIAMASRRFVFAEQQNPPFISIYVNDRSGGFLAPTLIKANIPGGSSTITLESLGVGDFNGDGRQDLAAAPVSNFSDVHVFLQTTAGAFPEVPSYSRVAWPLVKPMAGVDLDANGKEDLLIGHSNWGQIGYYLQSDGELDNEINVQLSGFAGFRLDGSIGPNSMATGDLNSDGCTDVAVAVSYNGLQVFMGQNCVRRHLTGGPLPAQRL